MTKEELRRRALETRRSLPAHEVARLSQAIEDNLSSLPEFRRARTVACYVAKESEVQTADIIRGAVAAGKRVLVPRVVRQGHRLDFCEIHGIDDLSRGAFGVLEPRDGLPSVPLSESQVVIVPVVAWDGRGYRLGYGGGYFDAALPERGHSIAVGLAMESQLVDRVPDSLSDVPLDMIVTEKRTMRFSQVGVAR